MAAPKGNQYTRQWTLENSLPRFEDALHFAATDDRCLSIQDAIAQTGIPFSTFDYLAENQVVLGKIKSDIKQHIIRRINRMALVDKTPPAPAIWRMKQLGEKEVQSIDHTTNGKDLALGGIIFEVVNEPEV